ncbi:hypothetical protein CPAST_c08440 [Clostridium pasteurianum DSM 525 = ATCC 6013]|jgi:hypothetical protein|uniref:Lipoprotein n=1 Tax=Clostridium pasteurianum DSM 525 = ATCC 6013 TaxID=1262449 RepID=A0A0H3J0S6_CLOPA|nr:hypothetical protein [Clostridium pasteurianum]AJA46944.1 hypothetical protein CPAST_c08440 [Clostridium pasteurianum DSM 525 = ATCC 6013]AJA50932.1 hypothetical protein CLPA_c08440 [Clostridium pasteurianum DSM 525 = ATCC 6013]AOZ78122.1 hypothetical protein AQ984_04090 [Clostridium pasteurianum]ELP58193.1 hypothetical protein F502_15865 [Clostridium pasteurianum DSM 525 = ATCC 6013]KRU13059.1 hypothetical protein CP6013_02307 [Clostridium pasteurianum DSM 525 = ATCC 6013]
MNKKIIGVLIASLTSIYLFAGCSNPSKQAAQNTTQTAHAAAKNTEHNSESTNHASENTSHNQASNSETSSKDALNKAFTDELTGLATIEQDVKKNDFTDAEKLAQQLHEKFHMEIVPALADKKGKDYAEDIHSKYHELQDAVKSKDTAKIAELIKVNRDNLDTTANILEISIKK